MEEEKVDVGKRKPICHRPVRKRLTTKNYYKSKKRASLQQEPNVDGDRDSPADPPANPPVNPTANPPANPPAEPPAEPPAGPPADPTELVPEESVLQCVSSSTADRCILSGENYHPQIEHSYCGNNSSSNNIPESAWVTVAVLTLGGAEEPAPEASGISTVQLIDQQTEHKNAEPTEFSILQSVQSALPPHWCVVEIDHGLHIMLQSKDSARVVQRSIFAYYPSGTVKVFAHGHELPTRSQTITSASVSKSAFVQEVIAVVKEIRLLEVCVGAHDLHFEKWWKTCLETCAIDNNSFHEERYRKTLRSNDCQYLVNQPKKFCSACQKVVSRFKKRKAPATPSSRKKTPNKFIAYKHLNSAEKEARQKRKSKDVKNLKRKFNRLKIDGIIREQGVAVKSGMDNTLGKTLEAGLRELQSKDSQDPKDRFLQVFIEQQLAARNAKGNHGITWHPLMIRFALQLKFCAQSSVNASRNFIRLPSDRLLWDYTHIYDVKPGVQEEFINEIAEKVHAMKYKYQNYHVLAFDEVTCKEGLVQRKGTGEIIGYAKLNEVQTELADLRKKLEAEAENIPLITTSPPPIARKMLSFMLRGTSSNIQTCVASYPVNSLSKEDLYQYVWEVTGSLEFAGVRVVAFVADGSAVNRSFFQMHPSEEKSYSGLVYKTPNPYDPNRNIFFIPDPPHALKTTRNCLENSGRKKSRRMQKNGEVLTWKPIIRLFKWKSEQTIKKLPKLTAASVYLNSYSRMSVPYACKVLSHSVSSQLAELGWPETRELCIFKVVQ